MDHDETKVEGICNMCSNASQTRQSGWQVEWYATNLMYTNSDIDNRGNHSLTMLAVWNMRMEIAKHKLGQDSFEIVCLICLKLSPIFIPQSNEIAL